jgi:hypothetical protein
MTGEFSVYLLWYSNEHHFQSFEDRLASWLEGAVWIVFATYSVAGSVPFIP